MSGADPFEAPRRIWVDSLPDEDKRPDLVLWSETVEEKRTAGRVWQYVILGTPRTKKTSNQTHLTVQKGRILEWVFGLSQIKDPGKLIRAILSRVKVQPSKPWRQWVKGAVFLPVKGTDPIIQPLECKLHVQATIYRDRAVGDWLGYMQGLADLLQERDVVVNDRQLVCWDGSRLDKDKHRPRIQVTLTEIP